ncbi:MAG: helix-turn-helix domain-containing protein [Veillonella sp.]|nr:helix-turn-helix domain-containing protein [Veillonella sp.]
MDPLRILKALSNPHRLDIILWLKHPEKEFGVQVHTNTLIDFPNSVSVKSIQKRCGVSQSSISTFMSILENAKLVESRKIDQYTYFRRNEEVIREFGEWYNKEVSIQSDDKKVFIQSDDIDKLLKTLNLEDTSYPTTEETSAPGEQFAAEINTKGSDHDENRK